MSTEIPEIRRRIEELIREKELKVRFLQRQITRLRRIQHQLTEIEEAESGKGDVRRITDNPCYNDVYCTVDRTSHGGF